MSARQVARLHRLFTDVLAILAVITLIAVATMPSPIPIVYR